MKKTDSLRFISLIMTGLLLILTPGCKEDQEVIFGTVEDIDANIYHTIKLGDQWWMVENLRTTRYNDDKSIPLVTDQNTWTGTTSPAYCWYDNNETSYKYSYGALYNWYAVRSGKLCPTGWHIPTNTEWTTLTDNLGGLEVAGGRMKEAGTEHWLSPNTGATNGSGLTALPAGARNVSAVFQSLGTHCYFWSATENDGPTAWSYVMSSDSYELFKNYFDKNEGYSVRCVKN